MRFDIFREEEKVLFELTKEDGGISLIAIDESGNGQRVLSITKEGELDLAVIKYDCLGLKLNLEKKIKRKTEDWIKNLANPVFKDLPTGGFIPAEREVLYGDNGPEAVFPPDYTKHPEKGIQGVILTDIQRKKNEDSKIIKKEKEQNETNRNC